MGVDPVDPLATLTSAPRMSHAGGGHPGRLTDRGPVHDGLPGELRYTGGDGCVDGFKQDRPGCDRCGGGDPGVVELLDLVSQLPTDLLGDPVHGVVERGGDHGHFGAHRTDERGVRLALSWAGHDHQDRTECKTLTLTVPNLYTQSVKI